MLEKTPPIRRNTLYTLFTAQDSTSQRNLSIICACHRACKRKISKIIPCQEIIVLDSPQFGGLLQDPGYALLEILCENTKKKRLAIIVAPMVSSHALFLCTPRRPVEQGISQFSCFFLDFMSVFPSWMLPPFGASCLRLLSLIRTSCCILILLCGPSAAALALSPFFPKIIRRKSLANFPRFASLWGVFHFFCFPFPLPFIILVIDRLMLSSLRRFHHFLFLYFTSFLFFHFSSAFSQLAISPPCGLCLQRCSGLFPGCSL